VIEGLSSFDQGRVTVVGWDVKTHARRIKAWPGVQLQELGLRPDLTPLEHVELFARLGGQPLRRLQAHAWLERVGLEEHAMRPRASSALGGLALYTLAFTALAARSVRLS
jgi:ABC-type multidrug transport system ATPase subunit